MPIKIAEDLPAVSVLLGEDVFAIDNERAAHQDIRPLRLLILNLMPNKIDTEIQLLRLISQSPLQIDVDFLKITTHEHKNTSVTHLKKFYLEFEQVKDHCYDGLIITGAPVVSEQCNQCDSHLLGSSGRFVSSLRCGQSPL